MQKNLLLFLLLVGFGIVLLVFNEQAPQIAQPEPDTPTASHPVHFLDNPRTLQFDEQGQLHYQFSAKRVEHYQPDIAHTSPEDYTLIENPEFVFFQSDYPPWRLTASHGLALGAGERISLRPDVLARQQQPEGGLAEMETEELLIFPRRQFASSDKTVMIRYPHTRYQGTGLEADFTGQVFSLLHDVKGLHDSRK